MSSDLNLTNIQLLFGNKSLYQLISANSKIVLFSLWINVIVIICPCVSYSWHSCPIVQVLLNCYDGKVVIFISPFLIRFPYSYFRLQRNKCSIHFMLGHEGINVLPVSVVGVVLQSIPCHVPERNRKALYFICSTFTWSFWVIGVYFSSSPLRNESALPNGDHLH